MKGDCVIGLEIHVQLRTQSKLFSSSANAVSEHGNRHVDPTSMGLPGALPTLNAEAVRLATRLARALDMDIAPVSRFDRKHYYYPDLPKNYQITQESQPLAERGRLIVDVADQAVAVDIARLHLEEDAGRRVGRGAESWVDLDRAGCPLVEIVTAPCIDRPEVAGALLHELRSLLRWIDVSDAEMESGHMRCDANVSVARDARRSARVELKNLNSISAVVEGLSHERERLLEALSRGEPTVAETRRWVAQGRRSEVLRRKETTAEYAFLPEFDLPPLRLSEDELGELRSWRVELPRDRRRRLCRQYGVSREHVEQICQCRQRADYFERAAERCVSSSSAVARLARCMVGLWAECRRELGLEESPLEGTRDVPAEELGAWVLEVESRPASVSLQREFLRRMFLEGVRAEQWPDFLPAGADSKELRRLVRRALETHPGPRDALRQGKSGLADFFVGTILREAPRGTEPLRVRSLLFEELNE